MALGTVREPPLRNCEDLDARAIYLHKKSGFEIEGTRRALSFREGEYVDAYTMARLKD